MTGRPQTITKIADDHDLLRSEVRTLIIEHAVPTYLLGRARVVAPEHWHLLQRHVEHYRRAKQARRELSTTPT